MILSTLSAKLKFHLSKIFIVQSNFGFWLELPCNCGVHANLNFLFDLFSFGYIIEFYSLYEFSQVDVFVVISDNKGRHRAPKLFDYNFDFLLWAGKVHVVVLLLFGQGHCWLVTFVFLTRGETASLGASFCLAQ